MSLTEYNEKEEREQLSQEFRKIGLVEGENRFCALVTKLKMLGRVDDVFKAVADSDFRNQLYQQYNL